MLLSPSPSFPGSCPRWAGPRVSTLLPSVACGLALPASRVTPDKDRGRSRIPLPFGCAIHASTLACPAACSTRRSCSSNSCLSPLSFYSAFSSRQSLCADDPPRRDKVGDERPAREAQVLTCSLPPVPQPLPGLVFPRQTSHSCSAHDNAHAASRPVFSLTAMASLACCHLDMDVPCRRYFPFTCSCQNEALASLRTWLDASRPRSRAPRSLQTRSCPRGPHLLPRSASRSRTSHSSARPGAR